MEKRGRERERETTEQQSRAQQRRDGSSSKFGLTVFSFNCNFFSASAIHLNDSALVSVASYEATTFAEKEN